ncbi:hypothetical protein VCR19J5_1210163 [Vibrio crassostreae]|nr:hypothetical protein VCR19J5_1210163 [Vibrio crassostreae]
MLPQYVNSKKKSRYRWRLLSQSFQGSYFMGTVVGINAISD